MPRSRAAILSALLLVFALASPATAGRDPSVVVTDKGPVRGTVTEQGRVFHRIPFAAPPVGGLRWRAPRPAAAWTGVRDATVAGPECAQVAAPELGIPRITTEDCLYLNVYTPPGGRRHRPVMVWFHGGGYTSGSANQYDGSALAQRGVVVVTVNYRLGAFGFLAHPALSAEAPVKSGNYGTLDQQAALRWVQGNAAAFGGDPHRVTIFGESAGAGSVCAHLTSPLAAGLFARAIVQSGPCFVRPRPDAEATGRQFATTAGCQGAPDIAGCLRARPVDAVLDAQSGTSGQGMQLTWAPTTGTPVLPVDPDQAIASGAYNRVPVMAGTTLDEGRIFAAFLEASGVPLNAATYPAVLTQIYGAEGPRVLARYPGSAYGDDYRIAMGAVFTDSRFACPTWSFNWSVSALTRTYAYEFADRTAPKLFPITPDFPLGAYHGAELSYLFPSTASLLNAAQRRLSEQMLAYWTQFAARGNPNGYGTPQWRSFRASDKSVLTLDLDHTTNRYGFGARHQCAFWATVGS